MSNTYYKQKWAGFSESIQLTAIGSAEFKGPNQLVIQFEGWNAAIQHTENVSIPLTQEEQDDLICGILERRGANAQYVRDLLSELPISENYIEEGELSKVHPCQ